MAERTWTWRFDAPRRAVWTAMADTARFNEAAGLPRHAIVETPRPDGSVEYVGKAKQGPFDLVWREHPVNWVHERWFEHRRSFLKGPIREICATFRLSADERGTRGDYTLEAEAANAVGSLILLAGFFPSAEKSFGRLAREADEFARGLAAHPFHVPPPRLADGAVARVRRMVAEIEATPHGHGLAGRLADHVLTASEVDLWTIRPLVLARQWNVPPRHAIELCLQAVRAGLLELRWDILCPRCRIAKSRNAGLDRLPRGAHCPTCNVDYERDFSRNVEASFHPAPTVRPVGGGEYCLFGPMSTPHVKVHVTVPAGAERRIDADLPFGAYRLRTLEPGPESLVDWRAGGFPRFTVEDSGVRPGPGGEAGAIALVNRTGRALTFVVEERAWLKDALTADRVTSMQAFRDLFSDAALRPGDDVAIGRVALMFTDLKGSTGLYQRIGDAQAFHLVREHFAVLADAVRTHDGAVVKTIGDAVMASFVKPADALAAALDVQGRVARFNQAHPTGGGDAPGDAIVIKMGVHCGPCIAVTMNDRIDYFGGTVNMAARLQGQSQGGDIVVSMPMAQDPEVERMLAPLAPREEEASLKGFAEKVPFLRVSAS
ncbi:MAG: adenylate/guanylate cyclase domain-containing protein [Alphaproteobacteria bacterium]|nr:adenylate/guanylate cyclase domain-containing protein [Alphaproteobacteria bacterium]